MGGGANETITGNLIGVAADGSSPLGNGGDGVDAISVGLGSVIGGNASSAWNTIADNGGAGIDGSSVVVIGNSIHDNGGLGIHNPTSQANGKITLGHIVSSGSSSSISGTLNSAFANNAYLVQVYASPTCDPSGSGEGQTPIGSFTLTPSTAGTSSFTQTVPVAIGPGEAITATTTIGNSFQGNLDTGEFSHCKVSGNADLSLAETVSPAPVDQGSKLTITYTVTNNGPDSAPGTSFGATFPSNATFAAATTTAGTCSGVKGSASCTLGTLANGQSATVTVVLFPVVAGTFASTGTVTSSVDDPAPGDETTSVPVVVHAAAFTPASYVVDSTGDGGDADPTDLLCDDGTGHCTLRAAIEQANLAPGANTITFAIPGSGVQTISPATALPTISDPVTIDATTQPGYAGQPLVELNGGATPDGTDALTINAGDTTVRGLVIDAFRGWAVHLLANGGDTIAGNYIGTTPDGMNVGGTSGQTSNGIFVDGVGGNTIGGTSGTTPGHGLRRRLQPDQPRLPQGGHRARRADHGCGRDGQRDRGQLHRHEPARAAPAGPALRRADRDRRQRRRRHDDRRHDGRRAQPDRGHRLLRRAARHGDEHDRRGRLVRRRRLRRERAADHPAGRQRRRRLARHRDRRAHLGARHRPRQRDRRLAQRGPARRHLGDARRGQPDRHRRHRHERARQPDRRQRRGPGRRSAAATRAPATSSPATGTTAST